jgi:hypothetical protein
LLKRLLEEYYFRAEQLNGASRPAKGEKSIKILILTICYVYHVLELAKDFY